MDAYGELEQTVGFFTLLEERLKLPFKKEVLGVEVTVERLDMTDDEQIVAVCSRGKSRQRVPILDLTLSACRGWFLTLSFSETKALPRRATHRSGSKLSSRSFT